MFKGVSEMVSEKPVVSQILFYTCVNKPLPVATISLVIDRRTYQATLQIYDGVWSMGDTSQAYLYAQEQDQKMLQAIMSRLNLTCVEDYFQALSDYFELIDASALCDIALNKVINVYK